MAQKRIVTAERSDVAAGGSASGGTGGPGARAMAGAASAGTGPKPQQPRQQAESTLQDRIRERAYEHYLQRGGAPGDAMADWCRAEREILEGRGG